MQEPRFRVRETPEWKEHVANLEIRNVSARHLIRLIDWSEDQDRLPL